MHRAIRATPGLPHLGFFQALTAAPSSPKRHLSNVSADEFVEQTVGTQQTPHGGDGGSKELSPFSFRKKKLGPRREAQPGGGLAIRKVRVEPPAQLPEKPLPEWNLSMEKRAPIWRLSKEKRVPDKIRPQPPPVEVRKVGVTPRFSPVPSPAPRFDETKKVEGAPHLKITKHDRRHPSQLRPLGVTADKMPEKPFQVFARRRVLNLQRLPQGTTTKDIVLSVDEAVSEKKVQYRARYVEDIVIRARPDPSEGVDATVNFTHPVFADVFYKLAAEGKYKVLGVVPEVSADDPKETSEPIAQLSKQDRAEYFSAPEFRKVVRRTPLIYN